MALGQGQVISWYICTIVAALFLATRLGVKIRGFGNLGIDDALLVLSACCLIGDLVIQQHMWSLGMAEIPTASREEFIQIMQMIVPGSILYVTSLWAIKFAMVLLYKKLAAPGSNLQKIYNVALGFLGVTYLVIFFDIIFQCFPHNKRWSQDPNYQCSIKASEINYWSTILLNIFSDVIILSLPITMVLRLQMPLKQRIAVAGIFALGFSVVIASIIRAYYSKKNETMLTCTVSMIETAVAIIAATLPALRSLFLGHTSRIGTGSNGRPYALSSHNRGIPLQEPSHHTSTFRGGREDTRKGSDSEDELVKGLDGDGYPASAGTSVPDDPGRDKGGIRVETCFHVSEKQRKNGNV